MKSITLRNGENNPLMYIVMKFWRAADCKKFQIWLDSASDLFLKVQTYICICIDLIEQPKENICK